MKKIVYTLVIISSSLLLTWCDIVNNITSNKEEINLSTPEWREAHCLQGIKEKIRSKSYQVSWDWESEDYWFIISDWLLEVDDWYYDVECSHEKNGEWFNVNIMPIEEITYGEPDIDYWVDNIEASKSNF